MPTIVHPANGMSGVPRENAFLALDDTGEKLGTASVIEYYNVALLPHRPLNYYLRLHMRQDDERALDMLMGGLLARSLQLAARQTASARIYMPCQPGDTKLLRALQAFGFQNDDAEIFMRKILNASEKVVQPPVGCVIRPVLMENEQDYDGLLARVTPHSLMARSRGWLLRMAEEQFFGVFGVWQESRLLGEIILTAYGTEGRIEFVYTRPEYRRRGVARALIAHASDLMLQRGQHVLYAEVWRRNERAMPLFQQMHFDSAMPIVLYPGLSIR